MTRVVYLDHVARLSGGEIALLRTLPALQPHVDVHVILGEDGPLVGELERRDIPVEVLPLDPRARDLRKGTLTVRGLDPRAVGSTAGYVVRLRRRLLQLQPDLIHTNSLKSALYGGAAGRLAGVPVVWHVRDRIAPDYLPGPAVHLVRAASQILPSAVVANSRATLATLPSRTGGAVVTNFVVPDSVARSESRRRPRDAKFRVGVIGRLAPWKGQHVFLDAFARAFVSDPLVEGWIIGSAMFGEDEYLRSLQTQAERSGVAGQIVFRGFRDDVWDELSQLDLLVHCSVLPEPFGQVVLEGLAAGVAVIAADAGGPADIITDSVDGRLTPPGDFVALAEAMRVLRQDGEMRLALARAGQRTAARFTPERTATQILDVYRSVLGRDRRSVGRRRPRGDRGAGPGPSEADPGTS